MASAKTSNKHWIRDPRLSRKHGHRKIWRLLAIALVLAGPAAATDDRASEPPVESLEDLPRFQAGNPTNTHKVVLITADSLSPATVDLVPGQLIAWISYAPSESTVVFERSVASSMICHSRVNFSFQEGELRSAPIHAGEFASFCELKPGSYRYEVLRSDGPGAAGSEAGRILEGEIVVAEKK
jgi:hypothetical protein